MLFLPEKSKYFLGSGRRGEIICFELKVVYYFHNTNPKNGNTTARVVAKKNRPDIASFHYKI